MTQPIPLLRSTLIVLVGLFWATSSPAQDCEPFVHGSESGSIVSAALSNTCIPDSVTLVVEDLSGHIVVDETFEPPYTHSSVAFDLSKVLSSNNLAGLYTVRWSGVTSEGFTSVLSSRLTIPCPQPSIVSADLNPDSNELSVLLSSVDVCQGPTEITLDVKDVTGSSAEPITQTFSPEGDDPLVTLPLTPLSSERRYTGTLELANSLTGNTSIPIELITGCGPFAADVSLADGGLRGTVFASQCHFPVVATTSITDSAGTTLYRDTHTLSSFDVDIPLPNPDDLPAGQHTASLELLSSIGRKHEFTAKMSVSCVPPRISQSDLITLSDDDNVNLRIGVTGVRRCLGDAVLRVQVRDAQDVVVFNTAVELDNSKPSQTKSFPISAIPGTVYFASVSTESDGMEGEASIQRFPLTYECLAPEVLDFGFASSEANSLTGVVRLAACNTPATYRLQVRNSDGTIVARSAGEIVPMQGLGYSIVPPLSLDHLSGGSFTASLIVVDNEASETTYTEPLLIDTQGPRITLFHNGRPIDTQEPITVKSIAELTATVSDPSGLLSSPRPITDGQSSGRFDVATSRVLSVSDQNADRVRIVGVLDVPRGNTLGVDRLTFTGPNGQQYAVPVTSTFLASETAAGTGLEFETQSIGYVTTFRNDSLRPGRYVIQGIEVVDEFGKPYSVDTSSEFRKYEDDYQAPNASLTSGVVSQPLDVVIEKSGAAQFSTRQSVYDGRYTLSVVGFDRFGNASDPTTAVIDLSQEKASFDAQLPAIERYTGRIAHRFESKSDPTKGYAELALAAKVVAGRGRVAINGVEIGQTVSDVRVRARGDGRHGIEITLINPDTDISVVLHSESEDVVPLQLEIGTYKPAIRAEPLADSNLKLRIRSTAPDCVDLLVLTDVTSVDVIRAPAVCAILFDPSAVSVRAKSQTSTTIGLSTALSDVSLDYSLGFLTGNQGDVTFFATETGRLSVESLEDLSPSIRYISASELREQSDSTITRTGPYSPGAIVVEYKHDNLVVSVNGVEKKTADTTGVLRIPVETDIPAVGATQTIDVRAYYRDYPEHAAQSTLEFTAVPKPVYVESIGGALVTTRPMKVDLALRVAGGASYNEAIHGEYTLQSVTLTQVGGVSVQLESAAFTGSSTAGFTVDLGDVAPGKYRLAVFLQHSGAPFSPLLRTLVGEETFTILDGTPLKSKLYSFRSEGTLPFVGQVALEHDEMIRGRDLGNVIWEASDDGGEFTVVQSGPRSMDFVIHEPKTVSYRARLINRHSQAEYVTQPISLMGYQQYALSVEGPSQIFSGWPVLYTANAPENHEVTWIVAGPHAREAIEVTGHSLEFVPPVSGTYYIEAGSLHPSLRRSHRTTQRVFRTLHASYPGIPAPVISGPTQVEPGATARFSVQIPDIFPGGNAGLEVAGEWELPDGTRKRTHWVDYTRPVGDVEPEKLLYHAWIEGAKEYTFVSAAHNISAWKYRWPSWRLVAQSESTEIPAVVRVSLQPESWRDWLDLGDMDLVTDWELPPNVRVLKRTEREVFLQIPNDRSFAVQAVVSDSRGNVAELVQGDIMPLRTAHFEVALRLEAERALHTAPISVDVAADTVLIPKNDAIDRLSFYLNESFVGSTAGEPMSIEIRTAGSHTLKVVAISRDQHLAESSTTFEVADNHAAECTIVPVGELAFTGVAKAECDDPDGEMVNFKWFVDGQPVVGAGPRVQIPMRDTRHLKELTLIAIDSGGVETRARLSVDR